mgnify:CR=1 FL=1
MSNLNMYLLFSHTYSFCGSYSFLNLWIVANSNSCCNISIKLIFLLRILFKGGNYSRAEIIWGSTVNRRVDTGHASAQTMGLKDFSIFSFFPFKMVETKLRIKFGSSWAFSLMNLTLQWIWLRIKKKRLWKQNYRYVSLLFKIWISRIVFWP